MTGFFKTPAQPPASTKPTTTVTSGEGEGTIFAGVRPSTIVGAPPVTRVGNQPGTTLIAAGRRRGAGTYGDAE